MLRYRSIISYRFCSGLPKPSRFAVEFGLQQKLQKVKTQAIKQQKATTSAYQLMIWGCLCVLGSIALTAIILPQARNRIYMYKYVLNANWDQRQALSDVINYQQKMYKNRIFDDQISISILQDCTSKLQQSLKSQHTTHNNNKNAPQPDIRQLLQKALSTNILNKRNTKNNYKVYHKYFQTLLNSPPQYTHTPTPHLHKCLSYLTQNSDIQTLYLLALLDKSHKLKLTQEQITNIRGRIVQEKNQIKEDQEKIDQIRKRKEEEEKRSKGMGVRGLENGIQGYLYWIELRKKWVRFIDNAL